jgi:phosphoglycerate dehydrogenase-like enzyme
VAQGRPHRLRTRRQALGVIGLGRIGGTVARKAQGIGMDVAAYDPFLPPSAAGKGSVPLKSLDDLLAWADIVTLHIPRYEGNDASACPKRACAR